MPGAGRGVPIPIAGALGMLASCKRTDQPSAAMKSRLWLLAGGAGTALLCSPSPDVLAFGRLVFKGMGISRPDAVIGKCRMIRHSRDRKNEPNPERFDRIAHTRETMSSDGLNSLSYEVLRTDRFPLYTRITVDIGAPGS